MKKYHAMELATQKTTKTLKFMNIYFKSDIFLWKCINMIKKEQKANVARIKRKNNENHLSEKR